MADENISGTCLVSIAALAAAAGSQCAAKSNPHTPTVSSAELIKALRLCGSSATTTSWLVAAAINAAVLGYVSYKAYRNFVLQHEKHQQLKRSAQRLWRLATQGGEAAGLVSEDLGEPDAAGVYSQHTATGTLYFRQTQPHPFAVPQWEWSIDRQLWIPTSYADSLWYSSESSPSTADKVLIRRLEVEGQLLARQQGASSSSSSAAAARAMLPPLDLSLSKRDLTSIMDVPTAYLCPISMRLMTQPVVTPSGATFDRPAILEWIRQTHTDPLSSQPLSSDQLVPNLVLRDMIHAWLQEDPSSSNSSSSSSAVGGVGARSGTGQPEPSSDSCELSPSKADQLGSGVRDAGVALTPGTPVRTSRNV